MRGDSVDGNINVIINNHATMSVQEETDVDSVRTIKNNTPVTDVALDKIYKIVETVVGTVSPDITLSNITVNTVGELEVSSFPQRDTELLYLGTTDSNGLVTLNFDDMLFIKANLGDREVSNSYSLNISGSITISGDISNYKNGSITLTTDESVLNISRANSKIYLPINVEKGSLSFSQDDGEIYSNIKLFQTRELSYYP